MKKIRQLLAKVYLFAIVVVIIFSLILKFTNSVSYFGYQLLVVMSDSMAPEIPKNSFVLVKENDEEVKIGEVVTFEVEGEYVTHRVVDIIENKQGVVFETKGDTNEYPDPGKRSKEEIVGRVIFSIPYLGQFFLLIGTSRGLIAFILSLFVLILLGYFLKLLMKKTPLSEQGIKIEVRNLNEE